MPILLFLLLTSYAACLKLYDFEDLVAFRHDIHKYAESGFQEDRTSCKVIEYLHQLGVHDDQIQRVATTGLIVDIYGKAPPSGEPMSIAYRSELDALPIKENNPDLEYHSVTKAAHTCGHDCHIASMLGGVAKILEQIDKIPSDKRLRILFQPSEETVGGALPMIKAGAMKGIDEVYAYHNKPIDFPGKLYVKSGAVLAASDGINITVIGQGGHSSTPGQTKDPIQPAVDILVGLRALVKEYRDKGINFSVSFPYIKASTAINVIPDTCLLRGLLRSFDKDFADEFIGRLRELVMTTSENYNCTADYSVEPQYPVTVNDENAVEIVRRVGKKVVGEENVSEEGFPVLATEDFSFFLEEKPGVQFALSSMRQLGDNLHTSTFNCNDDVIAIASEVWFRLAEDRFGVRLD